MRQLMARPAIAIAEVMHRTMHRIHAHRHPALPQEERLQIADTPDRDGQAIYLRPLLERRLQVRQVGLVQLGRPPAARAIPQPIPSFLLKPLAPHPHPLGRGVKEPRDLG